MKHNLNHIFKSDYPNPPTEMDLKIEVQDMLRHCQFPADMLDQIAQNTCPYYKEALLCVYEQLWHDMIRRKDPFAGYESGCNWICYWTDFETDFRHAYHLFQEEQSTYQYPEATREIEQQSPTDNRVEEPSPQHAEEPLLHTGRNELPTQQSAIANMVHQVTDTIKLTVKEIFNDMPSAQVLNMHIQQLTIPVNVQVYNAPIGQYTHTIENQEIK